MSKTELLFIKETFTHYIFEVVVDNENLGRMEVRKARGRLGERPE